MLYAILKIIVRLARPIFCRRIVVDRPEMLRQQGPLLLACNHPNSFLDAVILDILFGQPIWSLARGDVFKNRFIARLLTSLRMLPVYRVSEGVENLSSNYETFDACKRVFAEGGIVLIFSEGRCINEWKLRPLKKGTARLAISSWEQGIPLRVLPVGINYNSFRSFGKNVFIHFGEMIEKDALNWNESEGLRIQSFNAMLQQQLSDLVYVIDKDDKQTLRKKFLIRQPMFKRVMLAIPAAIGWLLHWPLYFPIQKITYSKTAHNDHYDSVMVALLLFAYPLYLLVIAFTAFIISGCLISFGVLLLFPFTAWCYVQLKPQLDR